MEPLGERTYASLLCTGRWNRHDGEGELAEGCVRGSMEVLWQRAERGATALSAEPNDENVEKYQG